MIKIKGLAHGGRPVNGDIWACCNMASLWDRNQVCPRKPASRIHRASCLAGLGLDVQCVSLFFSIAAILIARSSPPWFIVDRPFLFFIRHNPTGKQFSSPIVHRL